VACSLYRKYGTDVQGCALVLEVAREIWDRTDHTGFTWHEVLVSLGSARKFVADQERLDAALMARAREWLALR